MGNFMIIGSAHTPKKRFFAQIPCDFVLQLVIDQDLTSSNKKNFQFFVILYFLAHGRHMTNFENMSSFLDLMKMKHYLEKN
jgi:hypothetical protein